jgi:hypothetical protein
MAKTWAVLAIALALAGAARAEPGPATAALCDDYRAVAQAAAQDFAPVGGKPGQMDRVIGLAPDLLAPRLSGARLMLPDANECDVRPSRLRPGKRAYFCFWKSEQPDIAAVDQARRIARCLDAPMTKSDFSSDLTVVTQAKVRFTLSIQHAYDHDGVRLLVDGPQF